MTTARRQAWPPVSVILIVLAALAGAAALASLGVWQLHRLQWKLGLIERVEQRLAADPVAAPPPSDWPAVAAQSSEYLKVRVAGHFQHEKETLVQAVTDLGSGYWVLTPLVTGDGSTVLVNRGFVTPDKRQPSTRISANVSEAANVTGLLRITETGGAFLRNNDPNGDRWYARDVSAIAAVRDLRHVAPYFIDADATKSPGGWPVGGLTRVQFTNHHLIYAMTWFTLALMTLAAAGYVLRDWWRRSRY